MSNWAQSDREKVHRPRLRVINCAFDTEYLKRKK
jgi:hypothetical protein